MAGRRKTTSRATVLPDRGALRAGRAAVELGRLAPSGKSVLVGLVLLLGAVGGYYLARETSMFAVSTIEVRGGTPQLRAQVRSALRADVGLSLLAVDNTTIDRHLAGIPALRGFSFDRAFPHTLRVTVHPERPVLVLRQGARAYLVAASSRVLRPLAYPRRSGLPRLYVTKDVQVEIGSNLPSGPAAAAAALAPLHTAPLPGGVHLVEAGKKGPVLVLGGGFEVRLGDTGDVRLKLAIARRILRATGAVAAGAGYLDVSVPERPVLSTKSQVVG